MKKYLIDIFICFFRVFWRQTGTTNSVTLKNDSKLTSLKITGLKSGATYECSVKAGNTRGTSTVSEPVQFTTDEKYITSAASIGRICRTLYLLFINY